MHGLLQGGHGLCIAFALYAGRLLGRTELKALGGTYRDTGRLKTFIEAIHAEIAFDSLAGFRVPLGRAPGTGGHACLTADTKQRIHENDAVLCPPLHGPGRACSHTPGILTVKAGHECISCPGNGADKNRTNRNNFTKFGTNRQILVALARHFAAVAADALLGVLEQVVLAHHLPPGLPAAFSSNFVTVTKVSWRAGLPPTLSEIFSIKTPSLTPLLKDLEAS